MGVTNGFLKIGRDQFKQLENNQRAFAELVQAYGESNNYLDMDKAGYELLVIFNPSIVEPSSSNQLPYPNIAAILGGGQMIFPDLDLGYGPAHIVDELALEQSILEFDTLDFDKVSELATNEMAVELLMVDISTEELRQYHWSYLQTLGDFVREVVANDMIVLRY